MKPPHLRKLVPPLCQTSCRFDRTKNLGAAINQVNMLALTGLNPLIFGAWVWLDQLGIPAAAAVLIP